MNEADRLAAAGSEWSEGRQVGYRNRSLWWATALVATLFIEGCNFGRVSSIEVPSSPTSPDCDLITNVCGFLKGNTVEFRVWGEGPCSLARLNFGDGQFVEGNNIDFGQSGALKPWVVSHTYQGWPGPKTATAEGVTNCTGKTTRPLHVFQRLGNTNIPPELVVIGFQPPALPAHPSPTFRRCARTRWYTINFGCSFSGCIVDADGDKTSNAPANFPFPGFHKYSLILRVGTQIQQGGTNVSFTTNQSGPLEVCVNDDNLTDNTGAWGINILVDESQLP